MAEIIEAIEILIFIPTLIFLIAFGIGTAINLTDKIFKRY